MTLSDCLYLPVVSAGEFPDHYEFLCYDDETDVLHRVTCWDKPAVVAYYDQARNWSSNPLAHERAVLPCFALQGLVRPHMPRIYADSADMCASPPETVDNPTHLGYGLSRLIFDRLRTLYSHCTNFYGTRIS